MSVRQSQTQNTPNIEKKRSAGQVSEIYSLLKSLSVFLAIAFMLRASVVEAFKIPSSSMESTLLVGDHILVNKLSYGLWLPWMNESIVPFREPKRGDVVVFTLPDDPKTPDIDESETNIIKRVIGLPGEEIEVVGTAVFINGKKYDDPHSFWQLGGKKDLKKVLVPKGHVLLLGDNRDYSKDSRFWDTPYLDISRIKGRAFVIYWNSRLLMDRIFDVIR